MTSKMFFQAVTDQTNALELFLQVLNGTPYAVIGGVAVNAYAAEPMVTMDIDICVSAENMERIKTRAKKAGFTVTKHQHTIDLSYPGSQLKIQLQRQPQYQALANIGKKKAVMGYDLLIAPIRDVMAGKLAAANEPTRKASKRAKDQADILRLIETHPSLKKMVERKIPL